MTYDEAIFKTTNSAILGQIGQPPPSEILVALVETIGGEPDVVAAIVDWGENHTIWNVYACRGDIVARVTGKRGMSDWYGSRAQGVEPEVVAAAYRISSARSVAAENVVSIGTYQGFARHSRAKWIVAFADGRLEFDEHIAKGGEHIAKVARQIRQRFTGTAE